MKAKKDSTMCILWQEEHSPTLNGFHKLVFYPTHSPDPNISRAFFTSFNIKIAVQKFIKKNSLEKSL